MGKLSATAPKKLPMENRLNANRNILRVPKRPIKYAEEGMTIAFTREYAETSHCTTAAST